MAKQIASKPDRLKADQVKDIYSVSSCTSEDFCDYINYWKHNGYWLFDSPEAIKEVAEENDIELEGTKLFYDEAYEFQSNEDEPIWEEFSPEESLFNKYRATQNKTISGLRCSVFYSW